MKAPPVRKDSPASPLPAAVRSGPLWQSSLFWRILTGALVAFLTMFLTAGLSLWVINHLAGATNTMTAAVGNAAAVRRFSAALNNSFTMLDLVTDITYQPRFYRTQREDARAARQALSNISIAAGDQQALAAIGRAYDALDPELTALNDLADRDQKAAVARWQGGARRQLQDLKTTTQGLADSLDRTAATSRQDIADTQERAPVAILGIGVFGLLLGLALTLLVLHGTVQRISRITVDIERLAGGDLTPPRRLPRARATPAGRLADEVGTLERAYLGTIEKLRAPLQRIQEDAGRISSSSAEISAAAAEQSTGASEQAAAITETTVTVEQLNQTAEQIADAAASVAAAAEQALVSASQGQEAVRDSIIGMAMIRSRVNDITARILALSAQSQRITEIIDVIDYVAARTHILALNAAVESAGAGGEVGERFGVIASEVKKLAQRSAVATRDVRLVIAQVQTATNAAVMATEDGLKETEKGVQLAHQSGEANENIIEVVERTAQLANAISLATQQQRTASEQVVSTMREIAGVTRQQAAGSRQASAAAGELTDIAHELRAVTDGFRLDMGGDEPPAPGGAAPAPAPGYPALVTSH